MSAAAHRGRGRRAALLAPLALPLLAGCFATRNDVAVLQQDVAAVRALSAAQDSARARQLDLALAQLAAVTDTLRAMSQRSARFEGDARGQLRSLGEQLIQVQELTGQSQRRLQDLRASLDARASSAPGPGGAPAAPDTAGPGPNELLQLSVDQFRRGSFATARAGLADLLRRFPTADVAPEAQFYLAESLAGEKNAAAADTAYATLVRKHPTSPRAATAVYKRARARLAAGKRAEARTLFEDVVKRYPRSDEAALAREALRELARAS